MAVNREKKLLELFHQLSEKDQNSTLDFIEFLAKRKKQEDTEDILIVEADNSPLSNEEKKSIELAEQDIANGELVDWEDIKRELGL